MSQLVRIIKLNIVKEHTSLSKSAIYDKVKKGEFPKPVKLGPRSSGWAEHMVQDWINEQIEASCSNDEDSE
ncbi:hypothetical protein A3752_06740 [Oleiphilus sp. HI0081]|nr:hypothetical protein A3743_25955 [Oleiphilus sp. HI0072]KZY96989.1 hypothetical protein A3743_21415 [Oleiphilus sp. HI0072]KZZ10485.1 hypothetical protein A3749_10990 [Oleiphilus sp. HI0078]KZZ22346.1 hypothetical protein A3752_06740 [Oleiphilus sp. HI0081]